MFLLKHSPLSLLILSIICSIAKAESDPQSAHYHDTDGDGTSDHDAGYDQAQFLGKDQAKQFADYDPSVSEERLIELVKDQVDTDDGFVSEEELLHHLQKVHKETQTEELDSHWKDLKPKDGLLDWETHARSLQPGFFDERADAVGKAAAEAVEQAKKGVDPITVAVPEKVSEDERETLKEFFKELVRQHKRWVTADADKDGLLNREEFRSLLFPEEVPAMRDVVVAETMDQLDKDKDGRLSQEEYLAGQWTPSEPGEKEPHWLQEERESFAKKDANGDGYLDLAEVQEWIHPSGSVEGGHSLVDETKHLLRESDDNKDGKLSLDEIRKHRDLFAGSRATRYGEDVITGEEGGHDEL